MKVVNESFTRIQKSIYEILAQAVVDISKLPDDTEKDGDFKARIVDKLNSVINDIKDQLSESLQSTDTESDCNCTQNEQRPDIISLADEVLALLKSATSEEVQDGDKKESGIPTSDQVSSVILSDYTESKSVNESWRTPRRG